MNVAQFDIWIADLNPRRGTEPGKVRPVVILQTDLLNAQHPSIIICPITTNVIPDSEVLRIHLNSRKLKLKEDCDIMIDQIRAIDRMRLLKRVGKLDHETMNRVKESLRIVLDLE